MRKSRIPDVVVRRLPLYLRAAEDYARRDHVIVSSQELGQWTGLTPAQVRKDLTFFGEFGKQGIGYDAKYLISQLHDILRLGERTDIGLVGFGNLGRALVHYHVDTHGGSGSVVRDRLHIAAIFDVDPSKIGSEQSGVPVFHVDELRDRISELGLKIIVIAAPADHAQAVMDQCVAAGIKAVLNFAPVNLTAPEDVKVHASDLTLELQSLAFYTD
ncbi:MAG: redox-sensing transcriptional repressor Rex [Clostridia bacterium]|nr:redox-sensing transcriptional repressor Rex [Clostridia bacterium]